MTALAVWPASPRAFALCRAGLFVLTFVLLIPAGPYVGGLATLGLAALLTLCYMFALDDFSVWRRHRRAVWTLKPDAWEYGNPIEAMETHKLPLSEIASMPPRFFINLVLKLTNGKSVVLCLDGRAFAGRCFARFPVNLTWSYDCPTCLNQANRLHENATRMGQHTGQGENDPVAGSPGSACAISPRTYPGRPVRPAPSFGPRGAGDIPGTR